MHAQRELGSGVIQGKCLSGWSIVFMQRESNLPCPLLIPPQFLNLTLLSFLLFTLYPSPSWLCLFSSPWFSFPTLLSCPAAPGTLAEGPDRPASLGLSTASLSASASPTTWGLDGIKESQTGGQGAKPTDVAIYFLATWGYKPFWLKTEGEEGEKKINRREGAAFVMDYM